MTVRRMHILVLLCFLPWTQSFSFYQDRIPNGLRVSHPCKNNYLWRGVGHMNSQGGGPRNVFGLAFAQAGHVWTRELCQADSDGDGRSNGEELGDPRCVWTPGKAPERTLGITHPGICEPLDSEQCQKKPVPATPGQAYKYQRDWIADACKSDEFVCEHLNTTADVRKMELRLPPTPVPTKLTTFICAFFDFENITSDFHIIATTPIMNTSSIIHHMLLFGCPDDSPFRSVPAREPFESVMGGDCVDVIGTWTFGTSGVCIHPSAGVKVGKTGFKRMLLQVHWNNPFARSGLVDSSGLTLYYTPDLRKYNLGTLLIGQDFTQIPPFTDDTMATSDCTATCTRNILQGDIYITEAYNHMHYLGKRMYIEHHREEKMLRYLTEESAFSFDSPTIYRFQEPVEVKPGDMLRTTCHYKSTDKPKTTFMGLTTADEMCYGFLSFYPVENMLIHSPKQCVGIYKSIIDCDPKTQYGCDDQERGKFGPKLNTTSFFHDITSVCKPFGVCIDECKAAIKAAMLREPCMRHQESWDLLRYYVLSSSDAGQTLLAHILPCEKSLCQNRSKGT